ncbi:dephospho-CoA kinase [Arthrobacter sp. I2-34]|uniref:Dephospho-CoA kinase n=1 Tax=Arthrobacter hankyongi TaxID=2904801 RepID=A0ABS9L5T3_9MICC|nr:dephospho-CoA kinase [Arthrobacter hankyongi]MCG2622031.1 dephospho-CoA kinase [Arthrobacter hankyongi]
MLKVGLTGGIAAGKSLVAARLAGLGAVLIDADAIAREVVEPGTPGLRAVAEAFGPDVLDDAGALDRAALAAVVFGDEDRRRALNAIVHPLVRARAAQLAADAGAGSIIVQDIPLLVETGQGANFHLVLVVDAPEDERVRRMVADRGMDEAAARARIAAQASSEQRRAAADVLLENTGSPEQLTAAVDEIWHTRLVPFNRNLVDRRVAAHPGPPVLAGYRPDWADHARRLAARLQQADGRILAVDHIGSTAVPGMPAKDVIDLQVTVTSLAEADGLESALAAAGFPRRPGAWQDAPKSSEPDPARWEKRLHGNADPGRPANIHVRAAGSPGWRQALAFRDWLRADPDTAAAYLAEKRRVAALHAGDNACGSYARDKAGWFNGFADPRLEEWIGASGWMPPQY